MLEKSELEIIDKYVSEKFFDKEKLIYYLNIHEVVGIEIFKFVALKVRELKGFETVLLPSMCDEYFKGFTAMATKDFIKRIPFIFYCDESNGWMRITDFLIYIGESPSQYYRVYRKKVLSEVEVYSKLELLFYEKGYSVDDIYNYLRVLDDKCRYEAPCLNWFDYIDMCIELGWENLMPDNFLVHYNLARENLVLQPINYYIQELVKETNLVDYDSEKVYYERNGTTLKIFGIFPCDSNGNPIMRWIRMSVENVDDMKVQECSYHEGCMTMKLNPSSKVSAEICEFNEYGIPINQDKGKWVRIYSGPQTMTFNYLFLKKRRKELGYTQQMVAEAVEANLRTYQKWENGETTPDGYYLLRLLNWLDISDLNDVIKFQND